MFQLPLQITTLVILFPHLVFSRLHADLSVTLLASFVYQGDFHSIRYETIIHCDLLSRIKEKQRSNQREKKAANPIGKKPFNENGSAFCIQE